MSKLDFQAMLVISKPRLILAMLLSFYVWSKRGGEKGKIRAHVYEEYKNNDLVHD